MDNVIIALCADTHCGSSLGLIRPGGFNLHDGGTYQASFLQRKIWDVWDESWRRIAQARKGRRLIVVHDGDATEGLHHGTTQLVCSRMDEHKQIHIDAMDHALKVCKFNAHKGDRLYYVTGTEEHAGKGSELEEDIARDLDAVAPSDKRMTWDVIKKSIHGVVMNISHHGARTGNTVLTDDNSVRQIIKNIYYDCVNYRKPVPRYWIRAHNHRFIRADYQDVQGRIEGIVLPSFQMRTGYVYKKFNNREKPCDIGMIWIFVNEDGTTSWDHNLMQITQDEVGQW